MDRFLSVTTCAMLMGCLGTAAVRAEFENHISYFMPTLPTPNTNDTSVDYSYTSAGQGYVSTDTNGYFRVVAVTTVAYVTHHTTAGTNYTTAQGGYFYSKHYLMATNPCGGTLPADSLTDETSTDLATVQGYSIPAWNNPDSIVSGPTTNQLSSNETVVTGLSQGGLTNYPCSDIVRGWGTGGEFIVTATGITSSSPPPSPGIPTFTASVGDVYGASSPSLLSVGFNGSGGFEMQVTGANGDTGTVYAATDPKGTWSSIASITMTGSASTYTDTQATKYTHRFYKLEDSTAAVCAVDEIGFVKVTCTTNYNLLANQLDNYKGNYLNDVLPSPPSGTTIYKWDNGDQKYVSARFLSGSWTANLSLAPGEGVLLNNGSGGSISFTFVGEVPMGTTNTLVNYIEYSSDAIVSSMIPKGGRPDTDLQFPVSNGDEIFQIVPGSTG
ncbi:MAG: hypothetical protein KGS61_16710, partial [Verrucomicrobia bacterium]|nr:hypothetical protein [Verrucomicrobiota bacterium]